MNVSQSDFELRFRRLRWPPNGDPICPHCGEGQAYETRTRRNLFRCSARGCRRDFTVVSQTLLHQNKLSLETVYEIAKLWCGQSEWRDGASMARATGISAKSFWALRAKFKTLIGDAKVEDADALLRLALNARPLPGYYAPEQVHRRRIARFRSWG